MNYRKPFEVMFGFETPKGNINSKIEHVETKMKLEEEALASAPLKLILTLILESGMKHLIGSSNIFRQIYTGTT